MVYVGVAIRHDLAILLGRQAEMAERKALALLLYVLAAGIWTTEAAECHGSVSTSVWKLYWFQITGSNDLIPE